MNIQMEDCNLNSINIEAPVPQKPTPEYLQELLKDKKQLQSLPNAFKHVECVLEREIARVREKLFHINGTAKKQESDLPDGVGTTVVLQEKVFVPVKDNPTYNFVGRLLGPRGLTAKQLEQDLGCKIMVRGVGSMRDKKKEEQNRGKPNWEHLNEELHVLISVEDAPNRAEIKMKRAVDTIRGFLEQGVKTPENEDSLKQMQLMELAILNEKEKQTQQLQVQQAALLQSSPLTSGLFQTNALTAASMNQLLRLPSAGTQPNNSFLFAQAQVQAAAATQRLQQQQQQQASPVSNFMTPTVSTADPSAFFYQTQYIYGLPDSTGLFTPQDYVNSFDASSVGGSLKVRTSAAAPIRTHPYQRTL